ncbi:Ig-like domain repeat protein [Nitrosomonas ureae]|uniref:Ig-like domain repeat protein n=1 Tax=Nitrosomonas ureae TaxID=44577 RepID=UPI000D75733A|nr:Ig-like domain repeat protein [Nitrosomonas ureae]
MNLVDQCFIQLWIKKILVITLILIPINVIAENEVIPDFYQDPGIYPNRDYLNQHFNEHIDPFTGALQLHYVDIHLPGNGGFDLNITRSYNSASIDASNPSAYQSLTGLGWTIHFGRILKAANTSICFNNLSTLISDNPVLELPDGSRQLFAFTGNSSPLMLTTQYWKAECIVGSSNSGLAVYSPNGTRYDMTHMVNIGTTPKPVYAWYVTRITDRNGNYADISYAASNSPEISQVITNDGRVIDFDYADSGLLSRRITQISSGDQIYNYSYQPIPNLLNKYYLVSVTRPDGSKWQYSYNANLDLNPGSYVMQRVIYPEGGYVDYKYGFVYFDSQANPTYRSTVVTNKSIGLNGTWSFNYKPGSFDVPDITTVNSPSGVITYRHIGPNYSSSGTVWMVGLLISKTIGSLQTETYTWHRQKISNENYFRPGIFLTKKDIGETNAPILVQKQIIRDGANHTTAYSNFDAYGNPQIIAESGPNGGNRTTSLTYFYNTAKWIIKQIKNETFEGSSIYRNFDGDGNLLSINQDGVITNHTYDDAGNKISTAFPRSLIHSYSNHKRGIPQSESQPEGIQVQRGVSDAGNVLSETNGDGYTTAYKYDGLNRITNVDYPLGDSVSIIWGNNPVFGSGNGSTSKTATRGSLVESTIYDGFGRSVSITLGGIKHTRQYDALGRKVFESNPSSTLGSSYQYDTLNRVTQITHSDGTNTTISYGNGSRTVKDERGKNTSYLYRAYGDPDKTLLMSIIAPEPSASIVMARNNKGLITSITQGGSVSGNFVASNGQASSVTANFSYPGIITSPLPGSGVVTTPPSGSGVLPQNPPSNPSESPSEPSITMQGGITRTYTYNSNYYLISITDPETGTTSYGRDAAGNMISRKVGSSGTTIYAYDGQNRVVSLTYPGITPSINNTYTKRHRLLTSSTANSSRSFSYDANNNVTNEIVAIDGQSFTTRYSYNDNDQLTAITYPHSGRVVNYELDVLGRPIKVSDFINSVAYWPSGQISQISYANGTVTNYNQNSRLLPSTLSTRNSAGNLYVNSSYSYDGAGNLTAISDSIDSNYNRTMGYDDINRLTSISGQWGTGTIAYNGVGNITKQALGDFNLNYSYDSQNRFTGVSGSRAMSFNYDAYGNIINDSSKTYTYDDAPNLRCVNCDNLSTKIEYSYDSANQRISTIKGNIKTYEIYGSHGNLLIELNSGEITGLTEYIYLGGRRIAQVQTGQTGTGGGNPTTIQLLSSLNAIGIGESVTLNAIVTGNNPTGSVIFRDGATELGVVVLSSGQANLTATLNSAGLRTITAEYQGDALNKASTSTTQIQVNIINATVELTATPNPALIGEDVILLVTISGRAPMGSVTFSDDIGPLGTVNVIDNKAALTTFFAAAGTKNLVANYSGDENHSASTGKLALTVRGHLEDQVLPIILQLLLID